jgi:hypothetical protein
LDHRGFDDGLHLRRRIGGREGDQFVVDGGNQAGTRRQALATKFRKLKINPASVASQVTQMRHNRARHAKALDRIIEEQVDSSSAANLKSAGGGAMIVDRVMELLAERLRLKGGNPS